MNKNMFDAIFFLLLAILMSQMKTQWMVMPPLLASAVYYTKYALEEIKKEKTR